MKEAESFLKIVSDGLKTLAHSVETLAAKVDDIAKSVTSKKPEPKKRTQARPSKSAKPSASKAPATTATDKVLNLIKRSKQGVDIRTIMEKTRLNQHQVANIVYRLKKAGKIKSPRKGIYLHQNRS